MMNKRPPLASDIELGRLIERLRIAREVNSRDLARKIKVTEQQLTKYESGALIPMALLETIARELGDEIPKRIIRRIIFTRKKERETADEYKEYKQELDNQLIDWYREAFPDPNDYADDL